MDGGIEGKDDGYPKNQKRAYVLGRMLQFRSEQGSRAYQWGTKIVERAREHLEPDQLLAAETEAEMETGRTGSPSKTNPANGSTSVDLTNPAKLTKQEWKKGMGILHPVFAQAGSIQMNKAAFVKACGEPSKTQTLDDYVFWYYECKDGRIQLELDGGNLAAGIVSGRVHDY